jgi:tetratricopeptide (TPR) repeat protein
LKLATESKDLYEKLGDQEERLVKTHSQLGRILIGLNDLQKAEDTFHAGFSAAQQLKRKDEMGKNLLGLGEVHLQNKDYSIAIENLNEAFQIFDELEMKQESKEARFLMAQAEVASKQSE